MSSGLPRDCHGSGYRISRARRLQIRQTGRAHSSLGERASSARSLEHLRSKAPRSSDQPQSRRDLDEEAARITPLPERAHRSSAHAGPPGGSRAVVKTVMERSRNIDILVNKRRDQPYSARCSAPRCRPGTRFRGQPARGLRPDEAGLRSVDGDARRAIVNVAQRGRAAARPRPSASTTSPRRCVIMLTTPDGARAGRQGPRQRRRARLIKPFGVRSALG